MNCTHEPTPSTRSSVDMDTASFLLLELPVAVLHRVIDLLRAQDLAKLLQSGRAIAQQVMQHSAGRLTFKVELHQGVKLAAIRQLLQWAPPSTLKLLLNGLLDRRHGDWGTLNKLLSGPCSAPTGSHQQQQQQQQQQHFPCILELAIQGFSLPSLVPADMVALCPNLHTIHVRTCAVHAGSDSSSSSSSIWCTKRVHTLALEEVFESVAGLPTRELGVTVQVAEQLKRNLPNVTRLKLCRFLPAMSLLAAFGPGLTELHFPMFLDINSWHTQSGATHLQQLQKLVLQGTAIADADEIEQLLSLPSLTHLELDSLQTLYADAPGDYGNAPCSWQYLHLHLQHGPARLSLDTLAKLPLHSLTHPLKLGPEADCCVVFELPEAMEDGVLPRMERLAQQLKKCGVQLPATRVAWGLDDSGDTDDTDYGGLALALTIIAPAFGLHAHVELSDMWVHQPIIKALATVYGSSLKHLLLEDCTFQEDMRPIWQAALSDLPALGSLEVKNALFEDDEADDVYEGDEKADLAKLAFDLAAAMAQQPAGRCIQFVVAFDYVYEQTSADFVARVLEEAEDELAQVEVVALGAAAIDLLTNSPYEREASVGLCMTSLHVP